MRLWTPGEVIVLREVWRGRVYSAIPVRVVSDSNDFAALYLPPRTPCKWPCTREGATIRLRTEEWILGGEAWTKGDVLYLVQPGSGYTCIAFWNEQRIFDHWKVNLEEPMRRTPVGFDYMDQVLDIIISGDCSVWYWKDEDELAEAKARGIFSSQEVHAIRAKGARVIERLHAKQPPFDGKWEHWSPDPAWRVISGYPPGWDVVG